MPTMRRNLGLACVVVFALGVVACGDDDVTAAPEETYPTQRETLPMSLHATAWGMEYWYSAAQGGFENLTGVPYSELACGHCHTSPTRCLDCHTHTDPGEAIVPKSTCLSCHGRQGAEEAMGTTDVHRDRGMVCIDCHTTTEIHGDGHIYNSFLETPSPTCEGCHQTIQQSLAHTVHGSKVSCAACHMETAITCYNCHFQAQVDEKRKLAYGKFKDWLFLGNWNGQVYPMNFQTVEYQNNSFIAYGPFTGHTITQVGRDCTGCHGNAAMNEYLTTGAITVVQWDDVQQKLIPSKGVIPIPPDYETSLLFDFATRQNDQWVFLKHGTDMTQMLYGAPLTTDQMTKLAQ